MHSCMWYIDSIPLTPLHSLTHSLVQSRSCILSLVQSRSFIRSTLKGLTEVYARGVYGQTLVVRGLKQCPVKGGFNSVVG